MARGRRTRATPPSPPQDNNNNAPPAPQPEPIPPVQPNPIDPTMLLQVLQQLLQQGIPPVQPAPVQPVPAQPAPVQPRQVEARDLDWFLSLKPPRFDGQPDDLKATEWIADLEPIFRVIECPDLKKVEYAVFLLKGPARDWWRLTEARWRAEQTEPTWDNFLAAFRSKYIPLVVQDRREAEFRALKQENLTVDQYEAMFSRLIVYCPSILTDERRKVNQFVQGLNEEIRRALLGARLPTYEVAVTTALEIESQLQQIGRDTALKTNRSDSQKLKRPVESSDSSSDEELEPIEERCTYCDKTNHTEDNCRKKLGQCLRCGSDQHFKRDCPLHQSIHSLRGRQRKRMFKQRSAPWGETIEEIDPNTNDEGKHAYIHDIS